MTAILYGNLRVEIISDIGARVQRVGLIRPAGGLFRQTSRGPQALMLGEES